MAVSPDPYDLLYMDNDAFIPYLQQHTAKDADADEDGLPAESFDMYSENPLDFEEMTSGLHKDLIEVYELTGKLNRFSRSYPECCRLLEKLIKRLGSCLVTKAALEQKGFSFPGLKNLAVKDLYCMVSFNFRKTRMAFHDGKSKNGCADLAMLAQECRLVDLADRLKSTEEKILLIASGKIDVQSMLARAVMYKGQKGISRSEQDARRSSSGKAQSLPVFSSVIRKMIRERNERERKEREWDRFCEKDPFTPKLFKPESPKEFARFNMGRNSSRQPEETRAEKSEMPAAPKDNSFVNRAVNKMLRSAKKDRSSSDPKLEKEFDDSLLKVFNAHKRFMGPGENKAPLPGRA